MVMSHPKIENRLTEGASDRPTNLAEQGAAPPSVLPVRAVWIPWPIAVALAPLFWLMPKRFGPHFAAAGWRAAVVAHIAWGVYGIGSLQMLWGEYRGYSLISWLAGRTPEHRGLVLTPAAGLWDILRAPMAALAMRTHHLLASGGGSLAEPLLTWLAIEAGVLAAALAVAPYISAGERFRSLLGRALRLVLWSSTSVVLLAWMWQVPTVYPLSYATLGTAVMQPVRVPVVEMMMTVWFAYAAVLIIRGGLRYAGPAEGFGRESLDLQCEACGYCLTGLSTDGVCPECGAAVSDSLPQRRRPTRFAVARGLSAKIRGFIATWWQVQRDPLFFKRTAIRGAYRAGRRFAIWLCILTGGAGALAWMILPLPDMFVRTAWVHTVWHCACMAGVVWGVTSLALFALVGLVASCCSGLVRGAVGRIAVAVFYWSAHLLPVGLLAWLGPVLTGLWAYAWQKMATDQGVAFDVMSWPVIAALVPQLVVALWAMGHSLVRLARALRLVRWANG